MKGARLSLVRQFGCCVTASSLIAGCIIRLLFSVADVRAQGPCRYLQRRGRARGLALSDRAVAGARLYASFSPRRIRSKASFSLIAPDGSVAAKSRERHGGPPYFWFAEITSPAAGTCMRRSRATTRQPSAARSRARSAVRADEPPQPHAMPGSIWPLRNTWNRATENLYSAWIEKLFDAPLDATLSWTALHEVLRDRSRNFLFNHMGLREDSMGMIRSPRLRRPSVLFAHVFCVQMGLPFGYSKWHARRRRRATEMRPVVQHSESRGSAC